MQSQPNMDPVLPTTPAKKHSVWGTIKGTIKSNNLRLSPLSSSSAKEIASLKDSSGKKSLRRSIEKVKQHFTHTFRRQQSPKADTERQNICIKRPSSTSPCKSSRRTYGHVPTRRKSLSNLLSSFKQHTFSSKSNNQQADNVTLHDMSNSCRSNLEVINNCSKEMSDLGRPNILPKFIDPIDISDSNSGFIQMDSRIEKVVAKMTEYRHFYPPRFWDTVSAGDDHLRRSKPYKPLRDVSSKGNLCTTDQDRYLEESISLRNPNPKVPRPSSHRLRHISTTPVRVKFPWSGNLEVYTSRDKAIADLFENSSQLAERCIWDPVNRIFEAYPIGQEIFPAQTGIFPDSTSYFWLPTHSWRIPQDPLEESLDTLKSSGKKSFKETEPFKKLDFNGYESVENDLFEESKSSRKIHQSGYKAPCPSPHDLEAENESSLAVLSADEFDLRFESDSDISRAICEGELFAADEPLAGPLKIEDIAHSVRSSWYIPSGESREGTPPSKWTELEQMYLAEQILSQKSTVFDSARSSEGLGNGDSLRTSQSIGEIRGVCPSKVAIAAVTKDAFTADLLVWGDYYRNEILPCRMNSGSVNSPRCKDVQVVAALDCVEHVTATTDLDKYLQPGHILQADQAIEKSSVACPYAVYCHYHHSHKTDDRFNENERSLESAHSDVVDIFQVTAAQVDLGIAAELPNVSKRSADVALSYLEDILQITAEQDFQDDLEKTTQSFIKDERSIQDTFLQLSQQSDIFPLITSQEGIGFEPFSENERSRENDLSKPDNTLSVTATQGFVETRTASPRPILGLNPKSLNTSTNSTASGFTISTYGSIFEEDPNRSTEQNERDCMTVSEKPNRSVGTKERNPLVILEDFNIRLVGKVAIPERKNVKALVDIFQSRDLMPQTPPILQSNSRIGTPPGFQRSNDSASELGMGILNRSEFVNEWTRSRQGLRTSDIDTDVDSKFGEVLTKCGGGEENH